jgi:hypothetical protein
MANFTPAKLVVAYKNASKFDKINITKMGLTTPVYLKMKLKTSIMLMLGRNMQWKLYTRM